MTILPISIIIPTKDRISVLEKTLKSIQKQSCHPNEIIIIDASEKCLLQEELIESFQQKSNFICKNTNISGAASQRMQGLAIASQPFICLMDDDIELHPDCLERMWLAMFSDPSIGGVNAMIINQQYVTPGKLSATLYRLLHGKKEKSYAGKCIGPALNLLPEDKDDMPEYVEVEWLNSTCTLYRKEALPDPLFSDNFKGYSLMEDLALSLMVGKYHKLVNARTARIFHNSQAGSHKNNKREISRMELVNRHFIMTRIMERKHPSDFFKLFILQTFGIITSLTSINGWKMLPHILFGKMDGIVEILRSTNYSKQQ